MEMTVQEINEHTRSIGINTPNPVYRAIRSGYGVYSADFDNNEQTMEFDFMPINEGDLFCVSGCRKSGETSYYLIDGYWCRVHNDLTEHYANDELEEYDI